jgi:hypothetical protein
MLTIVPLELDEANELVARWHRHHKPVVGHRFSIGVECAGEVVGACIVGRPVARLVNYKTTLEVLRLVTNGQKNACSILYAAAARAGKAMGYHKIQTYILDSELGTSLTASGWTCEAINIGGGDGWQNRAGRRTDQPTNPKQRWVKILNTQIDYSVFETPLLEAP